MLRTNNRCVESLNISVEVAKCGKLSQIHPEHSLLSVTKNDSSRLNNLFMVSFQNIEMSSYAKKNNRCVASLNISVEVAKCGKFSQIHPEHSLLSVTKNDLSRLNNLFMVSFQHIGMSSYAKKNNRCVASLNISVEVVKCGKFSQIHPEHSLLSVTKYDLSRLNHLFMASFQLISMYSYAKNKQQMCRVTQHQRNVAKCGKYSQIHPEH